MATLDVLKIALNKASMNATTTMQRTTILSAEIETIKNALADTQLKMEKMLTTTGTLCTDMPIAMNTIGGELRGIAMALQFLHNSIAPGAPPLDPRNVDLTSGSPPPPPPPAGSTSSGEAGPSSVVDGEKPDGAEDTEDPDIPLGRRVGRAVKRIVTSPKSPTSTSKGKKTAK